MFGASFKNAAFEASACTFFDHQSFRFPKKATSDYAIVPRIIKRILLSQFKTQQVFQTGVIDSGVAIFDSDLCATQLRIEYVERQDNVLVKLIIDREHLLRYMPFLLSVVAILFTLTAMPALWLISVFSKNKLSIALWTLNLIEALSLYALLSKNHIHKLYYFNCHENDANLLAYALMKNGIYISKIPSEVPLQFWNKTLVANSLNICFRYQQDEYNTFHKTIFTDTLKYWIPETGFNMEKLYAYKSYPDNKNIGFYSSGMWLRAKKGRIDLNDNASVNETHLFNLLCSFVSKYPDYTLLVFLHPIEKAEYDLTLQHYAQFAEKVKLADTTIHNNEQFYNADVAVTLYSTLSYERIFWGYKTLIYPIGHSDFPLPDSSFNNAIIKTDTELEVKLLSALKQSSDAFFTNNYMSDYTYSNYNVFKKT